MAKLEKPYRPFNKGEKIKNKGGRGYSTERTKTIGNKRAGYKNINTLWKTKSGTVTDIGHLSEDRILEVAKSYEKRTGTSYPIYTSAPKAVEQAKKRSRSQGAGSSRSLTVPKPRPKPKKKGR